MDKKIKGKIKLDEVVKYYTQSLMTYMTPQYDKDIPLLYDYLDKLDTIRSTDFRNTFPELLHILNNE
jgi:hypothetical protein